jgi:thioredoxin reductase
MRFEIETSDGVYRAGELVVAVGVAEPYSPPGDGMEFTHHYADVRPAATYAGRRVLILGKQNSGFELATGLLPWACQLVLMSPSAAHLSVETRSLAGVRARYVQPFEDFVLGGGVAVLDAALDRIERVEGGDGVLRANLRRSDGGEDVTIEIDDAISATGFTAPLLDLPDLGVAVTGRTRLPTLTGWWESTTVPDIWFAGTLGQAAKGLKKHGIPANSGAVHGARYNARVLAGHIAETRFGIPPPRPAVDPTELVRIVADELTTGPELWHQRAYLARVITADPDAGLVDDGYQPLTHVLDVGGPDALIVTLEADGTGATYPVLYTRRAGAIAERPLAADPLLRYDGPDARRSIADIARTVVPGSSAD